MWPKALTQLVELAPHITRLLPLADRYFKDKTTGDQTTRQALDSHRTALEAQRAAVTDLSDRIHADIGAINSAQSTQILALGRQIGDLEKQFVSTLGIQVSDLEKNLVSTRVDALAAKQATESLQGRLAGIESAAKRTYTLAIVAVALLVAILILIATLFLRAR